MNEIGRIDAIVLDVDGTLYRPNPVRRQMALRLAAACVIQPLRTRRAIRVIRAFRNSLEAVRTTEPGDRSQPDRQFRLTAERTGVPDAAVRSIVEDWMFERPLALIGGYPRPGLHRFLRCAIKKGTRIGAFSDYPCEKKLESLGVRAPFSVVLSSYDSAVGRFKPAPNGFLEAARRLATAPARTLVIGDRDDTDGAGARAAGMPFIQIGSSRFPSFVAVCEYLFDRPAGAE